MDKTKWRKQKKRSYYSLINFNFINSIKKISDESSSYQNKLDIYNLKLEDSGSYECSLPDESKSVFKLVVLKDSKSKGKI